MHIHRFRIVLGLFIIGLVLSGVTAFPLLTEMNWLVHLLDLANPQSLLGSTPLATWILRVQESLAFNATTYPWLAYGTDWLAFGHLIIALFFIDPWLHPERSRPNLYVGIAACILVIPLAFICGAIRDIPLYWRVIACSFGVLGIIPLLYCLHLQARS